MRDVASNCYMFGPTSRNRVGLITYFDELYQEVLRNIRTPFAQFVIIDQIATWTVRQGATFNEVRATVTIQSIINMMCIWMCLTSCGQQWSLIDKPDHDQDQEVRQAIRQRIRAYSHRRPYPSNPDRRHRRHNP